MALFRCGAGQQSPIVCVFDCTPSSNFSNTIYAVDADGNRSVSTSAASFTFTVGDVTFTKTAGAQSGTVTIPYACTLYGIKDGTSTSIPANTATTIDLSASYARYILKA